MSTPATLAPAAEPGRRPDLDAPAEMFVTQQRGMRRGRMTYRRFATAAEAIGFAMEELPPAMLAGTIVEVAEERLGHEAIRKLYKRGMRREGR